jgi:trigger factor
MCSQKATGAGTVELQLSGVEVEESKSWQRVLSVSLPAEEWRKARAVALKDRRKKTQLPGFRKGKAPAEMINEQYGPQIDMEGLEWLLPRAWRQALVDAGVVPITDPEFADIDFGEESGTLTFKGTVEVRPEVKISGYKGLGVTWYKEEEPADGIERTLESLAESRAEFNPVERPAAEGDRVELDFRQIESTGEVILGTEVKDHSIEVGSPNVLKEFSDGLLGTSKGDSKRFPVTYPADFEQEALAGQTRHFLVTINEVAEKKLPEINDNFATEMGDFETLAVLKERIGLNIKADIDQRNGQRLEAALVQGLLSINEFEVPPSMIGSYVEQLIRDQEERGGRPVPEEERQKAREGLRSGAEFAIKRWFLQDAVAGQESLTVSDEDYEAHLQRLAEKDEVELETVKQSIKRAKAEGRIREDLMHRKVFDFLKAEAKIKEEAVPQTQGS